MTSPALEILGGAAASQFFSFLTGSSFAMIGPWVHMPSKRVDYM